MTKETLKTLVALLSLVWFSLVSWQVSAASPVWKVTKGDNVLYLAGTIHVLSRSDYPLPSAFHFAYQASESLVFETDIGQIQNPEIQQYFLSKMAYSDGSRLNQFLSEETYRELESQLTAAGMPVQHMMGFKPGFVGTTLTMLELQRLGMAEDGVDSFYFQKATSDGKAKGELESVQSQIDFIANMGVGNEDALIRHMLDEIKLIPELMADMKQSWRTGDTAGLETLLLDPLMKDYPEVYQSLLADRNYMWLPQIYDMLNNSETEFVLVGALHLIGKDGLLHQLKQKGYQLEQMP
ncbi:TraB/GumN family protein [Litoribrevibacter euphylliae]|uniref:TraB/GumN family protein n=1 Tax=Litoribrevibacter euphylliae TaxID=1834034 RepID=A0ABV7HMQ3_9GAMM